VADHLEVEQKYEAQAGFALPSLTGLPGVAQVGDPEQHRLDATYYDTADLTLIRNKVTLRRRTGGPDEGWHLKLPVRSNTRQELQEPLGSAAEVPPRLSSEVAELAAGRPLNPIATLRTERTVRRLFDRAGTVLAEVADDSVTAQRLNPGGDPAEPALSWREIEVELGEAPARDLLAAIGQLLRKAGAWPGRSSSKLARLLDESPLRSASARTQR